MSDTSNPTIPNSEAPDSPASDGGRPAGGTEHSWCKAVLGGTGIAVLALHLSRPLNMSLVQTALHKLQNSHPILRSKLRFNPNSNSFSFLTPPSPPPVFEIQTSDLPPSTAQTHPSLFHFILEHELNRNAWSHAEADTGADLTHATIYQLEEKESSKCVVALRLHTGACDRTAAVYLLRELMKLISKGGAERELGRESEVSLGIEDLVPDGKEYKPFWARGMDVLGYSLNSLRLTNLRFEDAESPRVSEVVRLQMDPLHTTRLLDGCKTRGIKLSGALAAAALIAVRSAKEIPDNRWEKYSVVTLMDCRSLLHPPLTDQQLGFYHSAIQNTHDINGEETLWELAIRTYKSFANSKEHNKHFSDMGDLNFLMCKAIDNPGLTPSSSLRTCFVSVFEDPVFEYFNEMHEEIGVEDYVGCASVHGVGPSIAIFDTVRDGRLDCACVYPSPLHSREQIQLLVDGMKKVLLGCVCDDSKSGS